MTMTSKQISQMIKTTIDRYATRHSTAFDFFNFFDFSDLADSQKNDNLNVDNADNDNSRWNVVDVDFFDSMHEKKFVHIDDFIIQIDKDIYFRNVHHFIRRINDIITVKKTKLVRQNLWMCFREIVLNWWTIELTDNEKLMITLIFDVDDQLQQWTRLLHDRFKFFFNIALNALLNERYTLRDAINKREFKKYVQKILLLTKNANLNNAKNQLNIIYNEIDSFFRKKDVKRLKNDDIVNSMLKLLNDCKHDWWNYEVKTMRMQSKSQSQSQKFSQNDQYDFKNSNLSIFQRRFFSFNQYKFNAYVVNQYNQKTFDFQNRYLNYQNDYQNNDYEYQQNQYDDQSSYSNRFSNVVDFFSSQRLQIIVDLNTTTIISASSNASNSLMINQRQLFRFRFNQNDYQQRFNVDRFIKVQSTYQINVENEVEMNENVNKNSNFYYHEENDQSETNWTNNIVDFRTNDSWNYNEVETNVNFVTSINFLSTIHACQKCSTKFNFRNKLFKHLRFTCWQTNVNHVFITNQVDEIKINEIIVDDFELIIFIDTSIIDNDYTFRNSHYVIDLIKKTRTKKIINCCLNIDCSLIVEDRVYVQKTFLNAIVQQLIASLSIRNIDNTIHNFNDFIVIDLFMNDHVNNVDIKQSIIDKFSAEIHIIDDLKANLFIENDVLNAQKTTINLKKQTTILINCRHFVMFIDIVTKKDVDQKRIVKSKTNFSISTKTIVKVSVFYHDSLSNDRDFLFESQCSQSLNQNDEVFAHVVDVFMNHVMMRNIIEHFVTFRKRARLNTLMNYNQQKCYNLTSNVDFLITNDWKIIKQHERFWKNKLKMTIAVATYVVSLIIEMLTLKSNFIVIDLKSSSIVTFNSILKHVLLNDVIIYDESNVTAQIVDVTNVYSIIWNDQNTIVDIFEKQWMLVTLKSNVVDSLKSIRVYSIDSKNRIVINAIFDKMHKKNKMTWVTQFTSFNFSIFVIWRDIFNDSKNRTVVNIRDLNKMIVFDFYSLSLQSKFISFVVDHTYINTINVVDWFHQFNVKIFDRSKFIVVSH